MGELLDGQPDIAYRSYGVAGVNQVLLYDDNAEHIMSRLGAQIAYIRCGDRRVYDAIVTATPPRESDILRTWALTEAIDHSKALYNQDAAADTTVIAPGATAKAKGTRKRGQIAEGDQSK